MNNSSSKNKDICQVEHEDLHMIFRIDNEYSGTLIVKNMEKNVVIKNGTRIDFMTKKNNNFIC